MKLKTKLSYALGFLFIVILTFGILSIFYIKRLSNDADKVLKNNQESLLYVNNMMKALENIPENKNAVEIFETNLHKQEKNITETGEKEATGLVRKNYAELLANPKDASNYADDIRQALQSINDLNQQAILRKNAVVQKTADDATLWLTIIFTILILISFTLVINFPSVISNPIKKLAEGIESVAGKDYSKRIHLKQKDEFGDLANTFNTMAEKLDEYEHSNLNKLMFEKRRIETIINQMNDGIIGLDEKKNILFLNVVSENLLGLKEKDVAGKYAADIALKNDLMRSLLQEKANKEFKIFANGKESYFIKENYTVKNEDEIIGEVIVLNNITPFHELDLAKTNFIATVSHELKTPISSILMSLSLLNDERIGNINDEQKQLIQNVKEDSERLLRITGELLKMTQVEAGKIQLNIQSVNPADIIQYAIDTNKTIASQKHIEIEVQSFSNLPNIHADKEKAEWVFSNLLSNAIHYSYENSKIIVSAEKQNKQLVFSVKDFGKGIDENYTTKIFDRYFRIPGSNEEGTGLGLAISKEFIEAQNGKIWVDSNYGEGSKFSFSLNIVA
jgi:PAS domain S-box-containing protein